LSVAFDEQYESFPDNEIALLARKFHVLHKFCKEMRRSPRGCFECGDTTHFIADCPKRKKLDSSNKYNNNQNDSSNKDDDKKKYHFGDKKKMKKFQKIRSWACAALSNFDFTNDDSSSSEEDEKVKRKPGDFTGHGLMGKSLRNISDSNISDDLSPESLSLRVVELENALCNQDKLLCKVFCKNKKLNLELESSFSKIASLRSVTMIWVPNHVIIALWSWSTMRICGSCILMLQDCLIVQGWNSESSKLIPHYLVLAWVVLCLDPIWRLLPLRLKILSTDLIMLLATLFWLLRA
jgi:hypothetical protein